MLNTTHHNARSELLEGVLSRSQPTKGSSNQKQATGTKATPSLLNIGSTGSNQNIETRQSDPNQQPSPFEHRHGRTIYNTSPPWAESFGDMLDAIEGDPTLMELHRIVKEERIRAAKEWQALLRKTNPFGTSNGMPSFPPSWSMAGYTPYQNEMGSHPMEDTVDEARLDKVFYEYFNTEDYMA